MNLLNAIAKTTLQIIIFDKATREPVQFGSGCIAFYQNRPFLITVDHVVRIQNQSTYACIVTGLPPKNGLIPYLTVGGFMNFLSVSLDGLATGDPKSVSVSRTEDLDIAFAPVPKEHLSLQNRGFSYQGFEISEGPKIYPILEHAATPDEEDYYGFSGYIRTDVIENIIRSEFVFKLNLTYQGTSEDGYHLFKTEEEIHDEDFAGTSGAPVINSKGQVVGFVSRVLPGSKSVFAFSIDRCRMLMDVSIMMENLGVPPQT